ncbi:MAG TPA: MiaB/RimO family radical SAM methylthiotransferase [Kiritimatiellae bacterium]|nr:MiaB/RimO family radical SAM methylthiotransferase [Kiritimatiellia bacterium]
MRAYRYRVLVLGCKVNQYEAQEIREHLGELGFRQATGGEAELWIIHGCAVTEFALRKTRKLVRAAVRSPGSRWVILTGCAAAVPDGDPMRLSAGLVPAGPDLLARLDRVLAGRGAISRGVEGHGHGISRFQGRTRAVVKVQDGCDRRCSYCIVPLLRGAPHCRSARAVYDEVRRLAAVGYREIVISGVNVGSYAADGRDLAGLLEMLLEVSAIARIRLSSLHPRQLSTRLLNLWGTSDRLAPHLHLPLQSGSDRILRLMRRDYSLAEYLAAVARAREYIRDPAVTTDVMVGFPGETASDFEETVKAVREIGFARVHVFPFSPRPGTEAAAIAGVRATPRD